MNLRSALIGFLLGLVLAGTIFYFYPAADTDQIQLSEIQENENDVGSRVPMASHTESSVSPVELRKLEARFKVRTLGDAVRKRHNGVYVLDSEIEQLMVKLESAAEQGSEQVANEEWERYAKLLTVLGMSEDDQRAMRHHFQKVLKAKLAAGQMATSLAHAQSDYEAAMRRRLGDNFDLYRAYEDEGLGRYEVRMFEDSLKQSDFATSLTFDGDQLYGLFSKYDVYSPKTLGFIGHPFQPNPNTRSGVFATEGLKQTMTDYREKAKALVQDPDFASLPVDAQSAVKTYLESTADQLSRDYRSSYDPDFAYAVNKMMQERKEGQIHTGKLKSGEGFSTVDGHSKISERGQKPPDGE